MELSDMLPIYSLNRILLVLDNFDIMIKSVSNFITNARWKTKVKGAKIGKDCVRLSAVI